MTKQADAEDWDDWKDDSAAQGAPPATSPHMPTFRRSNSASSVAVFAPDLPIEDNDDEKSDLDTTSWAWNLKHMEKDLLSLPPLSSKASNSNRRSSTYPAQDDATDGDNSALFEHILAVAEEAASSIHFGRERVVTLEALALVTKLHLLSVRKGFNVELQLGDAELEVPTIIERLHEIAGDWGVAANLSDEIIEPERQQIHEMSSLLHNALALCAGDISPFQQVIEQLFASLPSHRLKISVNWIRPSSSATTAGEKTSDLSMDPLLRESTYLQHLQELSDPSAAPERVIATLTEAEVFQDSKDIKRDELIINGEFVTGTVGYNAIVDALQRQIHGVLKEQVGKHDAVAEIQPHAFTETTRDIAKQILNACNRTESGGSSYEILGKFLSNHEMDTVLIRPDSAKAAPLEIYLDVGAFLEKSTSKDDNSDKMWAFGVRTVLSAVTWYLVCDAEDPTSELYEVKTTYKNRLAFPLALTPFHPLNSMRKDCGSVEIELVVPHASSPPTSLTSKASHASRGSQAQERSRKAIQEAEVDLAELL